MAASEVIKTKCKQQNIGIAELARRIGKLKQKLNKKCQRYALTIDEIKA